MDPERQRIQDDLRGLVAGDVRCDDLFLELFASDASVYQIKPLGVVRPRNTADVATVVKYAAEKRIPIHPRGAGTGLAGESLGRGLIVDFSKSMHRIVRTGDDSVRVQPGVVHALLNQHLATRGRTFGPNPANTNVTTIGSMIAIDGSGSNWLQYGSVRRHVESLQLVLADGTVMELGREPWPPSGNGQPTNGNPNAADALHQHRHDLIGRLREILWRESALIAKHQPRSLLNRCGYQLTDVVGESYVHVPHLMCGSEGTLALITEATLATQPLPRHRGVAMLLFDRLESAAQAVPEILAFKPGACDLLDRRHLSLARETNPEFDALIPPDTEALLLVEHAGDDAVLVRNKVSQTIDRICRKKHLAFESRQAIDPADVQTFWQLAERVVPTLHRLRGTSRPVPIVEDVAVAPDILPDFLVRMQNTLKRHQITASLYGHVGHGQLHIRPFLDLANPDDVRKMAALADDLYADIFELGGTISGEHGDGLSRTPFVRQQYGPLYDVFQQVKTLFDPLNILNPGKIVVDTPQRVTDNLRPLRPTGEAPTPQTEMPAAETFAPLPSAAPASIPVALHLNWSQAQLSLEAERCNGCGACRSQLPDVRMCPIFRVAPLEEASPRAKANLLRAVFEGQLDPSTVALDEFKAVADLCVNCHQCRLECPASVDIPKLMIEAKAMYVDANGVRPSDWLLGRFDRLSALGQRAGPAVELGFAQSRGALGAGKNFGHRPGAQVAAIRRAEFHAPRCAAPPYPPDSPQRPQGAVLRRHLRQLSRSAIGRRPGGRDGTQRRGRVRPSRSETRRHGPDYDGRADGRPPFGRAQRASAGRSRAPRLPHRGDRAL